MLCASGRALLFQTRRCTFKTYYGG